LSTGRSGIFSALARRHGNHGQNESKTAFFNTFFNAFHRE